jgi:hypothetical protein
MWSILASYLILAALVINHLIFGFGCWGFQPGGRISSLLYSLQILIAGIVSVSLFILIIRERHGHWRRDLLVTTISVVAIAGSLFGFGWRAFTSIHFQGPENLIPFLIASFMTITLSRLYLRIMYTPPVSSIRKTRSPTSRRWQPLIRLEFEFTMATLTLNPQSKARSRSGVPGL